MPAAGDDKSQIATKADIKSRIHSPGRIDALFSAIEARRYALVDTTVGLLKIPTFNPPGDNYLEICDHIEARLRPAGFDCIKLRAKDAPGDSDAKPRWNIIARREGPRPSCAPTAPPAQSARAVRRSTSVGTSPGTASLPQGSWP